MISWSKKFLLAAHQGRDRVALRATFYPFIFQQIHWFQCLLFEWVIMVLIQLELYALLVEQVLLSLEEVDILEQTCQVLLVHNHFTLTHGAWNTDSWLAYASTSTLRLYNRGLLFSARWKCRCIFVIINFELACFANHTLLISSRTNLLLGLLLTNRG